MTNRRYFIKSSLVSSAGLILAPGMLSSCRSGSPSGKFSLDDPLGINIKDLQALNEMPGQKLLRTGFIDVTKKPFSADPTGKKDSTEAIQKAVEFGRYHKLAVWFPLGTYKISDTIPCAAGWIDWRTPNSRYLPYVETWPCVLIGERRDGKRPSIVLAPKSPGFDNPDRPKPVIDFFGSEWNRKELDKPLIRHVGATNYNQLLYGINIQIGKGNYGAAGVTFDAAEGSTLQDCTFELGDGYTAVFGGPGSGGTIFNLVIKGGTVGMALNSGRPTCTLTGCRFEKQRRSAVEYRQRGPLVMVGCEFYQDPGTRIFGDPDGRGEFTRRPLPGFSMTMERQSVALIDCLMEYSGSNQTPALDTNIPVYIRDSWIRQAKILVRGKKGMNINLPGESEWHQIRELAIPVSGTGQDTMQVPVYLGSKKQYKPLIDIIPSGKPSVGFCQKHILWDSESFPSWNDPDAADVTRAPYHAKGDGKSDDTDKLQRAINENRTVFLPKGAYRITRPLKLRPDSRIIGISPAWCMICPVTIEGGDFNDPENPRPAIQTADASEAETQLAFFSIFMPREDVRAASMVDWQCGGRSFLRSVHPITGYTSLEIDPLASGLRPWHNWEWSEMEELNRRLGPVQHITPGSHDSQDELEHLRKTTGDLPDWPLIKVHGNGAGGFYPFYALDGRLHGRNHRRILVENARGPFALYHAQFQYSCGLSEMEISNSSNIAVYGIKNEGNSIVLRIIDSEDILITGFGGPGNVSFAGKFEIFGGRGIALTNTTNDWRWAKELNHLKPLIRVEMKGSPGFETEIDERPVLFKIDGS